jgi:hypothetical protein
MHKQANTYIPVNLLELFLAASLDWIGLIELFESQPFRISRNLQRNDNGTIHQPSLPHTWI